MKKALILHPSENSSLQIDASNFDNKSNWFERPSININFTQNLFNFNFPGLDLLIVALCGLILKKRKNETEPESKAIAGNVDVEETLINLDRKLRLEIKPKIIKLSDYNQTLFRWYMHSCEDFLDSVHKLQKEDKVAPIKIFELHHAINYFAKEVNEDSCSYSS